MTTTASRAVRLELRNTTLDDAGLAAVCEAENDADISRVYWRLRVHVPSTLLFLYVQFKCRHRRPISFIDGSDVTVCHVVVEKAPCYL